MDSFVVSFLSNLFATLAAASIAIVLVAEIKVRRLKSEFAALRDYLQITHRTRCVTKEANPQAECMDAVKRQLDDLMTEISGTKEGVLSFSYAFRRKIRLFEADIKELVDGRFAQDWMRLLLGDDSKLEQEFRAKIVNLGRRADDLAGELWFGILLIP